MKPFAYFRRTNWLVVAVAILIASGGCGGGCSGCGISPIPGGFDFAKRTHNAGQVRVSTTGISKITSDPAAVLGPLLGSGSGGVIDFPAPVTCSGDRVCCDSGGHAIPNCGPIDIDLSQHVGDAPRLTIVPNGSNALDVTILARVKTVNDLVVHVSAIGSDCKIKLNTEGDNTPPDMRIKTTVTFAQDANGVTGIKATNTTIDQLDSGDLSFSGLTGGDFLCFGAAIVPVSTITGFLTGPISDAINGATCRSCDASTTCAPGATCQGGTCTFTAGGACEQELGLDGRMAGASLFGSLSPGTTGGLDIYEVAAGYAVTNEAGGGISLGLYGGMGAGGTARDMCGPAAAAPPLVAAVNRSNYFSGNVRPDDNSPFDVAIGLHKSELAGLAWGGYEGGLFCLTIGHSTVAQLTTDTISLLSRSLGKLVEANSPMALGIRPQSPPVITLGKNTFTDDGTTRKVDDALLDIKFTGAEIDFFAQVNDQYIRVFTVVSDIHLPIGLDVGANGTLTPVLGEISDAFTNVSVKNTEAVAETPAELAALFPTLLNLVLPQLSGGLSAISLPKLGGLSLSVNSITSVDDQDSDGKGDFLAIFANLVPTAAARTHVETTFSIASITEPSADIAGEPAKWKTAQPPAVAIELGAVNETRPLEFQIRIDDGSWTPWSKNRRPVLSPPSFWLPGVHHVEARARLVGDVDSADPVPKMHAIPLGTDLLPPVPTTNPVTGFHGQSGAQGCACNSGGGAGAAAPFALVLIGLVLRRRMKRLVAAAKRLGPIVWLTAMLCVPGCDCGSKPCGDSDCMTGSLTGAIGRWTSIAGDDKRVMVATYDEQFGDLVIADVTDPTKITYKSIDGVPTDASPMYDPSTWRGGIVDPGTKVGAWTSIAIADHRARVAYQDRDEGTLKYATEDDDHNWSNYVVDDGGGEATGLFTSVVVDSDDHPAIAYMSVGGDDGMGHRTSELKLARGAGPKPGPNDWILTTVASAPASCAGLCGSDACIAGAAAGDPQQCVATTTDCTPTCASGDACVMGACQTIIVDEKLDTLPTGTGLFAKLLSLPDGRLVILSYDQVRRALVLNVESGKGTSTFAETILDGNAVGADRGMWATGVVGSDGTVYVAYQDALADTLMFTTWNGAAGTPELVDDGARAPDRSHPVGASASIYLASGSPVIAYQDGMTSDVMLAAKGSTWTTQPLAQGPLLDGFSIAATAAHGTPVIAWDTKDPNAMPISSLTVKSN